MYVVVNFFFILGNFLFVLLFLGMVINANGVETKKK